MLGYRKKRAKYNFAQCCSSMKNYAVEVWSLESCHIVANSDSGTAQRHFLKMT